MGSFMIYHIPEKNKYAQNVIAQIGSGLKPGTQLRAMFRFRFKIALCPVLSTQYKKASTDEVY